MEEKMNGILKLKNLLREIAIIESTGSLLGWDQETYMPKKAATFRAEQISILSGLAHRKRTGKEFEETLGALVDLDTGQIKIDVDRRTERMLKLVYRDYRLSKALPAEFVEELSRHSSESMQVWQKARKEDDFLLFAPYLKKMVDLQRKKADLLGFEDNPYDALLDLYEPGMKTKTVRELFGDILEELKGFAKRIREKGVKFREDLTHKEYPEDRQFKFGIEILKKMGFDLERGREDKSAHPFTIGLHPTDTRITTRFDIHDPRSAISSTIHEGGHGLYEQGLDQYEYGNPLGQPISTGMHESQSRFWENVIARRYSFWEYWFPRLVEYFPDQLKGRTVEDWYRVYNRVEPTLIRVESDEVHYNLHIMLRFDIENGLINGKTEVEELPEIWNAGMKEYVGVEPKNYSDGVLQDIHWSMGYFGYFPTYSLGNFYSAMIFESIVKDIPDIDDLLRKGEMLEITGWLNEKIHRLGRELSVDELFDRLYGDRVSAEPFLRYLKKRYSEIYQL